MVVWLMILQIYYPPSSVAVTQVGPFASREACEQAGQVANKRIVGAKFACVPSDVPKP